MARGGLDALSTSLPPTALAETLSPSANEVGTPLQGGPQGGGLGGQGPLGFETVGQKMAYAGIAALVRAELEKQAADWSALGKSVGSVVRHPAAIGAAGGAALGGWRGFNEDRAQGGSGISGALTGGLKGGAIGGAVGGAAGLAHSGAKVLAPNAKGIGETFSTAFQKIKADPDAAGRALMGAARNSTVGKTISGAGADLAGIK